MFKKERPVLPYTLSVCDSCGREGRAKFAEGDCLFIESSKCECGGRMMIEMIYGETTGR